MLFTSKGSKGVIKNGLNHIAQYTVVCVMYLIPHILHTTDCIVMDHMMIKYIYHKSSRCMTSGKNGIVKKKKN